MNINREIHNGGIKNRGIHNRGIHNRGIHNIGNTCYMNASLQSLLSCGIFVGMLEKMKTDPKFQNIDMSLVGGFNDFFEKFGGNENKSVIDPRNLKNIINNRLPYFKQLIQHDSHEFIILLLSEIHEETKKQVKINYSPDVPQKTKNIIDKFLEKNEESRSLDFKDFVNYEDLIDEQLKLKIEGFLNWKKLLEGEYSQIMENCGGLLLSHITCNNCNYESNIFEQFITISLDIPKEGNTIDDCLDLFYQEEVIDDFKCEKCEKYDITKTMSFYKLPKLLIIHLKRFKNENNTISKINSHIFFPSDNFCIDNYCNYDNKYELKSVVKHSGSHSGGHYTSNCRRGNKWYNFNDTQLGEIPENMICNGGYIFIYEIKK